jgi:hypothetical protein
MRTQDIKYIYLIVPWMYLVGKDLGKGAKSRATELMVALQEVSAFNER